MRYLILSDIHANLTALDAALTAANGRWESAACLGDLVGYGPQPNEVIERIRSLGAVTIRGNHDKAVSGIVDAEDFNPLARSATLWTREQIHPANLEYLEMLPKGPLTINGFSILHGALHDEDEYVFGPTQALDGLLDAPSPVSFFGHTHIQGAFTLRDDQVVVLASKAVGWNSIFDSAHRSGNNLSRESGIDWPATRWRSARCIRHCRPRKSRGGIVARSL